MKQLTICAVVTQEVICIFEMELNLRTCVVDQIINGDDFIIASPFNATIEHFFIDDDRDVNYMPRQIIEKFPNLKQITMTRTELSVVQNYFFKSMRKLQFLALSLNKITTLESNAFEDLTSVEKLWLHGNLIETLDEKIFLPMASLQVLWLNNNIIAFLSPSTFKIPGGNLWFVNLQDNACYLEEYRLNIQQLEADINTNCTENATVAVASMPINSKRSFIQGEFVKF